MKTLLRCLRSLLRAFKLRPYDEPFERMLRIIWPSTIDKYSTAATPIAILHIGLRLEYLLPFEWVKLCLSWTFQKS